MIAKVVSAWRDTRRGERLARSRDALDAYEILGNPAQRAVPGGAARAALRSRTHDIHTRFIERRWTSWSWPRPRPWRVAAALAAAVAAAAPAASAAAERRRDDAGARLDPWECSDRWTGSTSWRRAN